MCNSGTRLVPDWYYQSGTSLVPVWYQSGTSLVPVWYQVPGWYQSGTGTSLVTVWYQSSTSLLPVCYQSGTSLVPVWYQSGTNWYQSGTSLGSMYAKSRIEIRQFTNPSQKVYSICDLYFTRALTLCGLLLS